MAKNLSPWGKQCKIQMIALGKNLKQISLETDLSRTYISAIINGRVSAPQDTVNKISKSLEITSSNHIVPEVEGK